MLTRNQVTELLRHERLITTEAKAKSLRPLAEKMISLGKRGSLHARRQAAGVITDRKIVRRLFDDIAPRFAERPGGYTRITKLGPRRGDGAVMAQIELVERERTALEDEALAEADAASANETAADDEDSAEGDEPAADLDQQDEDEEAAADEADAADEEEDEQT